MNISNTFYRYLLPKPKNKSVQKIDIQSYITCPNLFN